MKHIQKILLFLMVVTLQSAVAQNYVLTSVAKPGTSYLTVENEKIIFGAGLGETTEEIKTNLDFVAVSNADWCHVSVNGKKMTIGVTANVDEDERKAEISVEAKDGQTKTISVCQIGSNPAVEVAQSEINISGACKFCLDAVSSTTPTFQCPDWIKFDGPETVTGTASYRFRADNLSGDVPRTGYILVSGLGASILKVKITQTKEQEIATSTWMAKWIQAAGNLNAANTWQVFRKKIKLSIVPEKVIAKISVDSKYWLWVNGKMVVFEGGLKRGPTPKDSYYDEVNIGPYLQADTNTIAILTLFYGKNGFSHKNSGHAALLFESQVGNIDIQSDASWEAAVYSAYGSSSSPVPNYRLCESNICFDGRLDFGQWFSPDYTRHFPSAVIYNYKPVNNIFGELVLRPIPAFKYSELKNYVKQYFDTSTGILHCQLPYNAQVTPYLKVRAKAGSKIDIRTSDYVVGGEYSVRGEYITRDSIQEYESLGWMNGNEVQYTIPKGVDVMDVKYRESGYDTEIVSDFNCNDSFFNELWKRSARTLYLNMRDTYFDCPDRERAQWWGDVTNDIQENFYTLSPTSWQIINKGINELMNWQRGTGVIYSPVPAGNWNQELPVQMLMSVGWYGFHTQYYNSGDSTFVAPIYDRLHKYLHEVWSIDTDGFAISRAGGWSWADWGDHIDLDLLTAEWYYLALKSERDFARQLNKESDMAQLDKMMKMMQDNFDKRFWSGTDYRSSTYTETMSDDRAQAMAVLCGLAGEDKYPAILKILKNSFFSSPLLEMYVQQALFKMGQGTYALQRAKNRYAKMLSYSDETTVFEFWDKGGSINHAWASGMTVIFGEYVCGVRPTSPGFKTFEVKPDLAGLTQVSQSLETKYGFIRVNLNKTANGTSLILTVPDETEATVVLGGKETVLGPGTHEVSSNN